METCVPVVEELTNLERALFGCDQGTLVLCEHQFCSADSAVDEASIEAKAPHVLWLKRPGVLVPLRVGANLRSRFVNLKLKANTLKDEAVQLLDNVFAYERACSKLNEWLTGEATQVRGLGPLAITVDGLKQQLQEVQVCVHIRASAYYCLLLSPISPP